MSLTLTRKVGESIQLGQDIEVRITQIRGGQVRLSVVAPKDVAIVRSEIRKEAA